MQGGLPVSAADQQHSNGSIESPAEGVVGSRYPLRASKSGWKVVTRACEHLTQRDDRSTITAMPQSSTRDKIIEAGIGLFLEKGYNGAGLKEILAVANVPKGSFYHFFDSKEDFGKAALLYYAQAFTPLLRQYLVDGEGSPLSRLNAFFEAMIYRFDQELDCKGGGLIGNFAQEMADSSQQFRQVVASVMDDWKGYFVACLEQAQDAGELSRHLQVDALAEVLLNSWEGALLKMKVVKTIAPLQDFLKVFFELLNCP